MRKQELDSRFQSIWDSITALRMDLSSQSIDVSFTDRNVKHIISTQNLLIAALVEAGILVDKKENSKEYFQISGKEYTIRKVK